LSLLVWYAVLGVVQATLALWVILAQPRRVLNWAVGALLMLWAGSGVVFQMWREATVPTTRDALERIGNLYEASNFFLILLIIDGLLLRSPKPRAWRWLLVVSPALMAFFWVAHATATAAHPHEGHAYANAIIGYLAQLAAVFLAIRAANDPRRSILQRRQAALLGLAFALLLAHAGASAVYLFGVGIFHFEANLFTVLSALGLVGSAVGGLALFRLPTPFQAGGRAAIRIALALAFILGPLSYTESAIVLGGRVIVLSGFSLVLAVAALRYDLGAARLGERQRHQALAGVLLSIFIAAVLGVAAWSLWENGPLVLGLALAALVAPVALLATPLKRLPAWVTRRLLLNPSDPDALRERVRVYAGTLRAATDADGRILPATEPALAALRARLGISQRDHDLLMAMGGDQRAGGIVAYRLALVGAAAHAESLDDTQLRGLRQDLGLTERDHALVQEHIDAGSDSLSVGSRFLGRYHVLRRLGEGGFGEVWLAHDTRNGTDVVLKHLAGYDRRDGAALKRARQEVRAARLLDHPNIVAVRDVEAVGDETYLVMEHMAGGSLADVLRARGRLPEDEVVAIAGQVLDALAALHARGFVHRDVKPGNILLDGRGLAKLGDFNIARELVSGETIGPQGVRAPVGTFAYMSLEQARGLAARPAGDLYGLAATMHEAIAGKPLLDLVGLSHTEAVSRIAQREPLAAVPHASPRVSAAIARALSRSSEDAFASAEEMKAALSPAGTPEGSGPRRPRRPA
jgi:hypothetical protein